jgi:hypothetical protein
MAILFDEGIYGSAGGKTFSVRVNFAVWGTKSVYQRVLESIEEVVGCCSGACWRRRVSGS